MTQPVFAVSGESGFMLNSTGRKYRMIFHRALLREFAGLAGAVFMTLFAIAVTTRLIRLLRAHGLVQKVPRTHRYVVTARGQTAITALLAARNAKTHLLTELAA